MDQKAQKRVAIARDVLVKLLAKEIKPTHCVYFQKDREGCEVCAVGSMVVACCDADDDLDEQSAVECLSPHFDVEQLALIEAAFEGDTDMPIRGEVAEEPDGFDDQINRAADMFGPGRIWRGDGFANCGPEPEVRLRGIMENILQNEGTFVP